MKGDARSVDLSSCRVLAQSRLDATFVSIIALLTSRRPRASPLGFGLRDLGFGVWKGDPE